MPNGVSEFFHPTATAREDFILYAGTREPRKGIADLLAAWRSLPSPRPRLLLAGSEGWKMGELGDAEVLGYVPRETLRDL